MTQLVLMKKLRNIKSESKKHFAIEEITFLESYVCDGADEKNVSANRDVAII